MGATTLPPSPLLNALVVSPNACTSAPPWKFHRADLLVRAVNGMVEEAAGLKMAELVVLLRQFVVVP